MRITEDAADRLVVRIGDDILPTLIGMASVAIGLSMARSPKAFTIHSGDLNAIWISGVVLSAIGVLAVARAKMVILTLNKKSRRVTLQSRRAVVWRSVREFGFAAIKAIALEAVERGNAHPVQVVIRLQNGEALVLREERSRPVWRRDYLLAETLARDVAQRIAAFVQVSFEEIPRVASS